MRLNVLIAALCVAGLTASFAVGGTRDHGGDDGTTTSTVTTTAATTTTTTARPRCKAVGLGGKASAGSVAFTVTKTSRGARKLANTAVTLTIPAGARVTAVACTDAAGALTLRSVVVSAPKVKGGKR